jgi:N-acetylmuramoyl-L-alanine amidase
MKQLIFFLLLPILLFAQEQPKVKVIYGSSTKEVKALKFKNDIYISSKDFAEKFSLNYFYNPDKKKAELKYYDQTLKLTANNPFVILTDKNLNQSSSIQIPVHLPIIQNEIYFPMKHFSSILEKLLKGKVIFPEIDISKTATIIEGEEKINNPKLSSIKITASEKVNGTLISINLNTKIKTMNHSLNKDTIFIIIPQVQIDLSLREYYFNKGLARKAVLTNIEDNAIIKICLNNNYSSYEVIQDVDNKSIMVTIHSKKFVQENPTIESKKNKWNFDVIVIDAGHGGRDYGAIGVNGAIEKEINLAIALKLGKIITENLSDIKVVYTRSNDKFIELYKRGKIANENNGKLFISIHCNSQIQKPGPANGFEVYLLRPGKTEDAISIAEAENKVIEFEDNPERYQKLTDENFILVSMAHSSYMKYSEKFAELLNKQVIGNLQIKSRGVKQAGFYVLVGASMPSVLVESGFISNTNDAAYLKSKEGQTEIAEAIFNAIKSFKIYYNKVIETE